MKILVILSVFVWTSSSYILRDDTPAEIPRNLCVNEPDGIIFAVVFDCNQFIMCLSGQPTVGRCRSSEPHFHKCFYRCVDDESVCSLSSCDGVTLPPPVAPPETEPPMTPAPTTEPASTSTIFRPPTVPSR